MWDSIVVTKIFFFGFSMILISFVDSLVYFLILDFGKERRFLWLCQYVQGESHEFKDKGGCWFWFEM